MNSSGMRIATTCTCHVGQCNVHFHRSFQAQACAPSAAQLMPPKHAPFERYLDTCVPDASEAEEHGFVGNPRACKCGRTFMNMDLVEIHVIAMWRADDETVGEF